MAVKFPDPRFMSDGYCREIIGDPFNMTCCGEPTAPGEVYCERHKQINERPIDLNKDPARDERNLDIR